MGRKNRRQLENALSRMHKKYEGAKADYKAMHKDRFNQRRKNLPVNGGSGDWHIRDENKFYRFIEDSYDLERNDSVVGQLVDRRAVNIIQDGFRLEPDTGDRGADKALKDRWDDWANDPAQCDVEGESTFYDFEFASEWTSSLAGDCGVSLTSEGPLQFFEPYLIRRENVNAEETFLGVDLGPNRKRLRYWIAEDSPDPWDIHYSNFTPIETYGHHGFKQFFHIYGKRRWSMRRGIGCFAPIFELTGMLDDVNFAKLVQQQIVSCITFLVEQTGPSGSADDGFPSVEPRYGGDSNDELYDELEPGAQVKVGKGKKLTGFSPNIPNPEYFEQYRLILSLICGNLELPFSVGMMDGRDSTFHGFIGATNEAKKSWRRSQNRTARRFHSPCYIGKASHFCDEDPALRRLRKRRKHRFYRHKWHKPVWASVQSLQDTNDRLIRLRNAIVSPSRLHAELNVDYESHVDQTVKDNSYAVRVAKKEAAKINKAFNDGQPIHWNQLYPMPMPEGVQASTALVSENEGGRSALELQQLGLARERAVKVGDRQLAKRLGDEMERDLQ